MKRDEDLLGEAVARLKQETAGQQPSKALVDETIRRLAASRSDSQESWRSDPRRFTIGRTTIGLSLAAAAMIMLGFAFGRLSGPAPVNLDKLRETLAPSLAASLEPAIRAKVVDDLQHRYQLALATTYVKLKEELTQQYRDEMNRAAIQTLAVSNTLTNRLLAELVENIDTAQAEDRARIAQAIHRVELNRVQDKTQLAAGLQTVANRTEETRQFVQLLVDVHPEDLGAQPSQPTQNPNERTEP
jgi:hypothetical protein